VEHKRRAATADSATLEEQCHPRKIFIGGLAHKTTTQHLRDHFGRFGTIVDAVVLRWPDGRSRGFGYVTFADSTGAASVLKETHALSGREVDVKRAVPGTNKLFVGGLPQNTTANELREHFEKFGVVSDAVVMIDPATSRSRGFGFVCFLPGQEGSAAVTSSLQEYENHRIRGKWIEVKSAAPPHKLAAKQDGDSGKEVTPSDYDYEELAISGALQGKNRLASSPSPSVENREPNERKGSGCSDPALGSPRKVALPTSMDGGYPMQAPPPGLGGAPRQHTDPSSFKADAAQPGNMPWFYGNPWLQYPGPGFQGFAPHFAPFAASPQFDASYYNDGANSGLGQDFFRKSPSLDQSGLAASESLQRNLEQFLRQSVQQKIEWGGFNHNRDPSVTSTTCSAATQNDVL
jgi:RNA recognition motif-containing protein